jgi:large subunit ribosomal protein L23
MATKKVATKNEEMHVLNMKSAESIVFSPRITEKATKAAEHNTYTFNVAKGVSKSEIKQAIKALYDVLPVEVHVVTITAQRAVRGTRGSRLSGRKAYVTLKKGDTIKLM